VFPAVAILILATLAIAEGPANAQCPTVGADTGCGVVITITNTGATVSHTGQGPYDQIEDTLVGVINNSNQPISVMQLRSALPIFALDGDGLCSPSITPRPAGCPFGPTGYEGPGTSFSNISSDKTSGTVNFNPPIPTGGKTAYFSLEEDISTACSCPDVLNKSVPKPPGGGTEITATFTPQNPQGKCGGNPLTLQQAAFFCGFTEFNWQSTVTMDPCADVFEVGSTIPLSAPPPYNDPPLKGYSYQTVANGYPFGPNAVQLPVYYNLFTPAADPLSLAANELPTHDLTSTMLNFFDGPTDKCLSGRNDGTGKKLAFTTHLVGIVGALPGAGVQDTGIGFGWTTTYNGTSGGISVRNGYLPVDPGSGTGGITITSFQDVTNYQYNGIVVTTVNGVPVGVDTTPPVITVSANPSILWPPNGKMVTVTVSGTITDNEPGGTGVNPSTAVYMVTDEYALVQPSGSVPLQPNGSYSFTIQLEASRNGNDQNGRQYMITIGAQDNAGNPGTAATGVLVPHDQGH